MFGRPQDSKQRVRGSRTTQKNKLREPVSQKNTNLNDDLNTVVGRSLEENLDTHENQNLGTALLVKM